MEIITYDHEIHKEKKVVVYGTGEMGYITTYCLQEVGVPVYRYAERNDSYHALFGNVISVEELYKIYKEEDPVILFCVSKYARSEAEYLYRKGIRRVYSVRNLWGGEVYGVDWTENCQKVINDIDKHFFTEDTINDPKGLYLYSLDAVVTERCSLKCRACSNLMQYYQHPQNMDILELKKSIDKLLHTGCRIFDLRILGGEPLMNKEFVKILDWYQDEKQIKQISIFSNGTIFPDSKTLEHIKSPKVFVRLSDYGAFSYKLREWVQWCVENNVKYEVVEIEKWHDCGRLERHDYSEQELMGIYSECICRNLPTIKGEYLYNCPYAANAADLGAMMVEEMQRDRMLLTGGVSAGEIDNFLYERKYLEACRYCRGRNLKQAAIEPYVQTKYPLAYKRLLDIDLKDDSDVGDRSIKMNVLVSVVIAVFNMEEYIERCLTSILKSSYRNLDVIVVDDGSEDDTVKLSEKIARQDAYDRVRIIQNAHAGVVTARNTGILAAKGKYIAFVDADDYIGSERIASMMEAAVGCDLVCAGYTWVSDDQRISDVLMDRGQSKSEIIPCPIPEGVYEGDRLWAFIKRGFYSFSKKPSLGGNLWKCIFRTDIMKNICGQIDSSIWYGEDLLLYQTYTSYCSRVRVTKDAGYYYCFRDQGKRYLGKGMMENMEKLFLCLSNVYKRHPQIDMFESSLREEYVELLRIGLSLQGITSQVSIRNIYYPYYGRLKGKKIVLYGAGNVGKAYYQHMMDDGECLLVAWVDKNAEKLRESEFLPVKDVDVLYSEKYDFIVVAVYDEIVYRTIYKELIVTGIRDDVIIWSPTRYE